MEDCGRRREVLVFPHHRQRENSEDQAELRDGRRQCLHLRGDKGKDKRVLRGEDREEKRRRDEAERRKRQKRMRRSGEEVEEEEKEKEKEEDEESDEDEDAAEKVGDEREEPPRAVGLRLRFAA